MPNMPLFGIGTTKLQPVYVGDVAEAVAKALAMPATKGEVALQRLLPLGAPPGPSQCR